MSDFSESIEAERERRSRRTGRQTRKDQARERRGRSKPGGLLASCGCRFIRTGGYWYHVTPCRGHDLREWPVSEENMLLTVLEA